MTETPTDKKLSERALTARDALVLSVPEKGFGNERANVTIENLAKVGWVLVPRYSSPGPSGYSPDEFALYESPPSAIREAVEGAKREERESCAKLLERLVPDRHSYVNGYDAAVAIRARGEEKENG